MISESTKAAPAIMPAQPAPDPAAPADANANPFFFYKTYSADNAARLNCLKFQPYIGPNDTVLEVGAKGGHLLREIKAAEKVAVEADLTAHEVCRGNGVPVFASLAELGGRKFTRIISHHRLEHLPYPMDELRRLRSVLTDDGKIVINLPIDDWRDEIDWRVSSDHHLHTWTPPLLANTLADAGYEVEFVNVLTHAWPPKWQTLMRVLPGSVFHSLCWMWAAMRRRRQLIAVAHKRPDAPGAQQAAR